jgi:hypothetical protein
MKSKFLALVTALAATGVAMAQDDGGDTGNIFDSIASFGVLGLLAVGAIIWWLFFRGGGG